MANIVQRSYDVTKDSIIALFSVIVSVHTGFDTEYKSGTYNYTGEGMSEEDAVWTFHEGDSYEIHFQVVYNPRGWCNYVERDQRQIAWDSFYPDHSFTPQWMFPKLHVWQAAARVTDGVVRFSDDELKNFTFIKRGEDISKIVEDDWVQMWQREPRNARD